MILIRAQAAADRLESDSDPGVFGGVLVVEVAGGDGDQLVDRGEAAGDRGIGGAAVLEGAQVGGDAPPFRISQCQLGQAVDDADRTHRYRDYAPDEIEDVRRVVVFSGPVVWIVHYSGRCVGLDLVGVDDPVDG